MMPDHHNYNT
jgi:hypothetical protein